MRNRQKVLFVDDIADTGKTPNSLKTMCSIVVSSKLRQPSLYQPPGIMTPNFRENQTNRWIIFSRDTKETLRRLIQMQHSKHTLNQEIAKLVKAGFAQENS